MLGIIISFVLGTMFGLVITCVCVAGGREDERNGCK